MKSIAAFIVSFLVLSGLFILMDKVIFNARGLSFIYQGF